MAAFAADGRRVMERMDMVGKIGTLLVVGLAASAAVSAIDVAIASPSSTQVVFGEVEVVAEVYAEEAIEKVEFFLDGQWIGTAYDPPYRVRVDVGQENAERSFRAVAHGMSGGTGEVTVVTPAIEIQDELDVALQQLYVTVTRGGERVLDLAQDSFTVRDDGQRQTLVTFARGDIPLTAALVLDSSESMRGEKLKAALLGAQAFVEGMAELDEAAVFLFSDRLLRSTPFAGKGPGLLDALQGVEASGNTALNDHLYLALKLLDARQGRRVVVLLSDGADLHSVLSMNDVLWKARRSQALIYWIRLAEERGEGGDFLTSWRDLAANRQEFQLVQQTVEESGGRVVTLYQAAELEGAFRDILRELREQYVLGYYPSNARNDGSWRRVKVEVAGSGLRVRTRGGYVDL